MHASTVSLLGYITSNVQKGQRVRLMLSVAVIDEHFGHLTTVAPRGNPSRILQPAHSITPAGCFTSGVTRDISTSRGSSRLG